MEPATIMAGVSVAQSLLGSASSGTQWKSQARKAGQDRANVEVTRNRALAAIPAQVAAASDAALAASLDASQQGAAAEASATVQAAAAGAAGSNVDQTLQQTGANEARLLQTIESQRRSQMLQFGEARDDIIREADAQTPSLNVNGGGTSLFQRFAAAGLAGTGAYYGSQA